MFVTLQQQADPLFLIPIIDEQTYLNEATHWADSGFATEALNLPFWQPPGYMMVLAAWIYMGGSTLGFIILQLLLGTASSWLIYHITLILFGPSTRTIAVVAAIGFSLCPSLLYYETKLLKPALSIFLMLLIIFTVYRQTKYWRFIAAGLLSGALLLVEAYFIVVPLSLLIARRTKLFRASIMVTAATAVTIPVVLLNAQSSGSVLPGSYNGAINLHVGNNANWIETYNTKPGWEWDQLNQHLDHEHTAEGLSASDRSALYYDDVFDYMCDQPGTFAKALFTKTLMLFSALELPRDGAIIFHPKIKLLGFAANTLLIILALLIITRVRDPVLILPLLMLLAISIGFFPSTRYRLPMIPLLLISAGSMGISSRPLRLKLIIPAALVLVCFGSWMTGRIVDHDKWLAFSLNDAAWYHIQNDDMEKAKKYTWEAMRAAETPGVLNTAGMIAYGENEDDNTAIRYFNKAIEQNPDYPDSYLNRGRVEAATGNRNAAYQSYALYLKFVSTDRPGTTDYKFQSVLSALSFTAQLDLEKGHLEQALDRFRMMRNLHYRAHGTDADLETLNTQIYLITRTLETSTPAAIR